MAQITYKEQKKKRWPLVVIAILLLTILAVEGLAGHWISVRWTQLTQAEEQLRQMQSEQEAQQVQIDERQSQVEAQATELGQTRNELEEKIAENEALKGELQEELLRLDEAQQLVEQNRIQLDEWTQEIVESRRNWPSNYAHLYPNLYAAPAPLETKAPAKTVYLTFDDGPSGRTAEILDILKANGVKATFFVTGQGGDQGKALMRRIVEEGHTIAVHTYSHQYERIYASVEAYLADFNRIYTLIYETTGVKPQIFRFPGGTINVYNREIYKELVKEMDRRGFVHYDWNALNGDSEGINYTVEEMTQKALAMVGAKHVIVLMHDCENKYKTVECLQGVIDGYRDAGYNIAPLTPEIKAITYDK